MKYIGEDGVAAYGVLMYVQFIFIAIYIGYAIGSAPVISYHYGAENEHELKNMFHKSITIMISLGIILTISAIVLAPVLGHIFVGYDQVLFNLTTYAFKLFSFSFLFTGLNIFASSFFTALNNGVISAIISFTRTLVFQMIAILVLPLLLQTDGIWLSNVFAEAGALIVSLTFILIERKEYNY